MTELTLRALADLVGGRLVGDGERVITGIGDLRTAGPDQVGCVRTKHYAEAARVTKAMGRLQPKQKKVLSLAVCEGWPHQQIADHLGLPLGTVKTHVRRGLIRVRELLKAEGGGARKEGAS